ncbi:MAG: hypothetical protein WCP64_07780 [Actinomycetes bacterium]
MLKRVALLAMLMVAVASTANAATVTGTHGEKLSVSKSAAIKSGDKIVITGSRFDETVGIYVAICKVVPKGKLPTPCGGGADKSGATGASQWISSNPPSYGIGLAIPYLPGGRFSVALKISPMIGKLDCRKIKCAIYTRADHTRGDDRSYDLSLPLQFKK